VRARLRRAGTAIARHPLGELTQALYRRYRSHNVAMLAAALAYYAAFSLGPLLLLLGGWLGVVLRDRPEVATPYREALEGLVAQLLPLSDDAGALVQQSLDSIVQQLGEGALLRSLVSLLVLLWAASNFFASLQLALERIFDVASQRGFVRNRLVALALVFAVAAFVAVEVVGASLGNAAARLWDALVSGLAAIDLQLPTVTWPDGFSPARLALGAAILTLAFRWLPREHSDWLSAAVGGSGAVVALALLRQLLVGTFSVERVNLIYGVVTGAVVLLLWLYFTMLVVLVAAVVTAELSERRSRRRTRPRPDQAAAANGQTGRLG